MKLSLIRENNNIHEAYHVTDSFHIVKLIFEEGFKADSGAGRVCLSATPWDDFGMYVILTEYVEDEWHSPYDDNNSTSETGAKPENCKPIKWGFLFDVKDIVWVGSNVDIDLSKYDQLVRQKAKQYDKEFWLYHWERDLKTTNSKDRALASSFGKSYSYEEHKIDEKIAQKILREIKRNRDIISIFKASGMTEAEFKDYLIHLLYSDQLDWSMIDL